MQHHPVAPVYGYDMDTPLFFPPPTQYGYDTRQMISPPHPQYIPPQYNSHHQLPSNFLIPQRVARLPQMDAWAPTACHNQGWHAQQQHAHGVVRRMSIPSERPAQAPLHRSGVAAKATCLSILNQRTPDEMQADLRLQRSIQRARRRTSGRTKFDGYQFCH